MHDNKITEFYCEASELYNALERDILLSSLAIVFVMHVIYYA